jgi:hypothetical protein
MLFFIFVGYIALYVRIVEKAELQRMKKEVIMACFKSLPYQSPGGIEKDDEKLQSE